MVFEHSESCHGVGVLAGGRSVLVFRPLTTQSTLSFLFRIERFWFALSLSPSLVFLVFLVSSFNFFFSALAYSPVLRGRNVMLNNVQEFSPCGFSRCNRERMWCGEVFALFSVSLEMHS